jgi:polar amino acid transport system ATP-binding protein
MVSIEHLSKICNGKTVLKDISLTVNAGSIALLVGGSGAGKSTLLRILNGLEIYDSGSIKTTGAIGMVFQHWNLFEHLSVERNITLALEKVAGKTKAEAHAIAARLLKEYGLSDKALGSINQLSGGEKQRLAIARALALDPQIICMDEPTSALDPRLTRQVAGEIQALAHKGYSVIIATHDMALLDYLSCTVYLIDQGTIVETAITDEFKADPTAYKRLCGFTRGHQG